MSVGQMEELREVDQTLTEERNVKTASQSKRNPPARNSSRFWFERFLAVILRHCPTVLVSTFLSQIAPSNEGKLLAQLKFLHVIDEQGKPTQLLPQLNMLGDEQKRAFQEISRESYYELLNEVKVEKAVPDDIINFFIRKYSFTRDKAVNAARFFLYLAEKGSVQVSPELITFNSEKTVSVGQNGSATQVSIPRMSERVARPPRSVISTPRQTGRRNSRLASDEQPMLQATVSIKLDKDTPKEYWDRVLALLGERNATIDAQVSNDDTGLEQATDNSEREGNDS